jgi:hypothetical protein
LLHHGDLSLQRILQADASFRHTRRRKTLANPPRRAEGWQGKKKARCRRALSVMTPPSRRIPGVSTRALEQLMEVNRHGASTPTIETQGHAIPFHHTVGHPDGGRN